MQRQLHEQERAELMYKLLVAEIAVRRGQLELAVQNYLDVARETGDEASAERAVRIAIYARDEARGLEAAEIWTRVTQGEPNARRVYALLLARAGREEEAAREFLILIDGELESDPEIFDRVADLLARERDAAVGMRIMERIAERHAERLDAQRALVRAVARNGELERAYALIETLYSQHPDDDATVGLKARLEHLQKRPEIALQTLADFLVRNPEAAETRMAYARLLVDSKHYDEARDQFLELSRQDPEDPEVAYALGLLMLQTSRYEDAEVQFRRLIELRDREETAYYYLGQIAETRGADDQALRAYRRVDRGEHRLSAQIRAANIYARQGDIDKARRYLQAQTASNRAEQIRLYRAEAEILAARDMLDAALDVYTTALDAYPEDTDLLYARAML
ncbi:MAG: tetratricopeptide repeat protein, partial [Gammaproteobacteria bacterium]|nr:tetratricopeptide repeat protein [Gammaproteobacteria bacterium]